MRMLFSALSLLVVLAIVGVLVSKSLRGTQRGLAPVSAASGVGAAPAGNVRDQSRQMQEQVKRDVARALEQGAQRSEAAEK